MVSAELKDVRPASPPGFELEWTFQIDAKEGTDHCLPCSSAPNLSLEESQCRDGYTVLIKEHEHYMADGREETIGPAEIRTQIVSRVVSSFVVDVERG